MKLRRGDAKGAVVRDENLPVHGLAPPLRYAAAKSVSDAGLLTHLSWGVAAVAIAGLFFLTHRYLSKKG